MRYHATHEHLQLWPNVDAFSTYVRSDSIVAVRVEPVIRQRIPTTALDIVFRASNGYVTIPYILIDAPQIVLREADRFVWPISCASGVDDTRAEEIEAFLMPWLRSITLGRALTQETIRHFGNSGDRETFELARSLRYAGAAPLPDVTAALGPYVYASRYASAKKVAISGAADAMQGAAYLSRVASVLVSEASPADRKCGSRWFAPISADFEAGEASVLITSAAGSAPAADTAVHIAVDGIAKDDEQSIACAHAYPTDFLFTYGTLYGPAVRHFSVAAAPAEIPQRAVHPIAHVPSGGSGGRILIGVRRDWALAPDADVESALELAALLSNEGLHVDVSGEPTRCDYLSYDVVHAFNLLDVKAALGFLEGAKTAGIPAVLTANFLDVTVDRTWGAESAPTCFRQEMDEANIARYLRFMGRRALLPPGWNDRVGGPFPEYAGLVKNALEIADLVIAESQPEEALLRQWGRTGPIRVIEPFVPRAEVTSIPPVAVEGFVLVHAPIEPRCNQLMAIRAARLAGRDIVLAGPDRDMEYAARVREFAGNRVVFADPRDAGEVQWLYATAATILDPSWSSYGTGRLWRAVLSGARVCASDLGWGPALWPQEVRSADPAAPEQMAAVLGEGEAPDTRTRARLAQRLDVSALLKNTIAAYLSLTTSPARA